MTTEASPAAPAAIAQPTPQELALSGSWTARGIGADRTATRRAVRAFHGRGGRRRRAHRGARHRRRLGPAQAPAAAARRRCHRARCAACARNSPSCWRSWRSTSPTRPGKPAPAASPSPTALERIGRSAEAALEQAVALLGFVGESAVALAGCLAHPARFRWRVILYNIRSAGFDALPIVGLLSFLLGIVVAYQGADQLRQYGANIFVADLVGLSMLREFAPLITAIIVAGRSGSAYAAQIGTMAVTEEIDAMRTIGIAPLELLVLPKIIALLIALPLLTVFADVLGVFGGMIMARAQLGVGFGEFLDRFVKAVSMTAYLVGIGKAPVFAAIIAVVGCFQGFRTKGGADSVGRQTTRSVVQSIFLVIVADALFSIAFSALEL